MTPKEKWNRLNNPQCLEDFGLSLTTDEMMTFPEGKQIVKDIEGRFDKPSKEQTEEIKNKMPFELVESEMPKEDPSRFSSTEKIAEEFERVNAKLRELEKQIKQMGNTMILLHPEAC